MATTHTNTPDRQTLRDDFERFCNTVAAELTLSSRTNDFASDRACGNPVNDFADGEYENPVAWYKKHNVASDRLSKDVLFDSMDMKYIALAQYGPNAPEYIKWKIFGYNLVITFEYLFKGQPKKALEIIGDTENVLNSIGGDDPFLKSIKVAMNHVTFSMKAHVLKRCCVETEMERFVMPNNMNNANKAGLFGIQALFFYEYDILCSQLSKDSILKAISLNEAEPEWYFLLARILRNWAKTRGGWTSCEEEFQAAKTAVEIGNKDQHKIHFFSVCLRMNKNNKLDEDSKKLHLDTGLKILNEVIGTTKDLVLLKYSLSSLTQILSIKNDNILETLDKLISKLETSDNGYVHGSLGNYYLFRKKDNVKALFHLKKAYDAKSFGCSLDYIYTLHKMNSSAAPVEELLVEMLKTFPHPVHQEKILSQIISYLLITKNDVIRSLKYIPMLLSLKNITCVYSLQNHRMKFQPQHSMFNMLDILSEKLNSAVKDQTLPTDYVIRIADILNTLESYKSYVSNLMRQEPEIFGNNFRKNSIAKYDKPSNSNDKKESWIKNSKQTISIVKNKDESNWRTLKPDSNVSSNVFSRGFQKPIYYNNNTEGQSWFNSKK